MFASELIGTALLVLVGLSLVILMFGTGSPIGRESGAHINPVVPLGFWLMGKMEARVSIGFVLAQLIGAYLGALPLLAWGSMGRSVAFGATMPGEGYSTGIVLLGEGGHDVRPDRRAVYISRISKAPPVHSGDLVRGMAGMVDLLGRSTDRHPRGGRRLQLPGEADHGREAVLLR
jgi:hypothetical protein